MTVSVHYKIDTPFAEYFWEWCNTFKREQYSIGTQKQYENIGRTLQNYSKDKKISEIDRVAYQNFINYFGKNHAKHTVQKLNIIIRSCVKNAIYDDVIRKDFTRRIQLTYDPVELERSNIYQRATTINSQFYQ